MALRLHLHPGTSGLAPHVAIVAIGMAQAAAGKDAGPLLRAARLGNRP